MAGSSSSNNNKGSSCGSSSSRQSKVFARPNWSEKLKVILAQNEGPQLLPRPRLRLRDWLWLHAWVAKFIWQQNANYYNWLFILFLIISLGSARFLFLAYFLQASENYLLACRALLPTAQAHTHTHRHLSRGDFSGLLPPGSFCITLLGHNFHRASQRCARKRERER